MVIASPSDILRSASTPCALAGLAGNDNIIAAAAIASRYGSFNIRSPPWNKDVNDPAAKAGAFWSPASWCLDHHNTDL
jgi:hypothetical protein